MNNSKSKIILLDDDQDLLDLFQEILAEKYDLTTFVNCQEALDYVNVHFDSDLIICDYMMPKMTGPQFLKTLRRQGLMIPIMFFTGNIDLNLALEALRLGAVDILEKNISATALEEIIERVLILEESKHSYYRNLKDKNQKDKMLGLMVVGNMAKNAATP